MTDSAASGEPEPAPILTPYFESRPELRSQILMYESARFMTDAERATFFGLPQGCRMREGAKIISPENLRMGEHCWIGEGAILDASGGLEIGSHTSIGLSVFLWTHSSHLMNIKGDNTREGNTRIKRKPTKIGSNCFIAGPSVVMPGVTIGDRCIISPMSLVDTDLPDGSVYKPYSDMKKQMLEMKALIDKLSQQS